MARAGLLGRSLWQRTLVHRFVNKGSLTAFADVDPGANQSGTYEAKSTRSSKRGSPKLRKTLFVLMTVLLQNALVGFTNTMLTSTLRSLETDGLIHREQFNEMPPRVEYSFTQKGRDLMLIFYAMMNWVFRYADGDTTL